MKLFVVYVCPLCCDWQLETPVGETPGITEAVLADHIWDGCPNGADLTFDTRPRLADRVVIEL